MQFLKEIVSMVSLFSKCSKTISQALERFS